MNDNIFITAIVAGITFGTPLVFATVGEILAERSGVLNLGIEGIMLIGAVTGFWATQTTGSPGLGILAGALAGAILGFNFAFAAVSLRANQVGLGLALTIFGAGLSAYVGASGEVPLVGTSAKDTFRPILSGEVADWPVVGPILLGHDPVVYLSWLSVAAASLYLFRTRPGLAVRAVGDDPVSADAMGLRVNSIRYIHVVIGAAAAGLAGAYVSIAIFSTWIDRLSAGQGWIAIALVVVSGWRPWRALFFAYAFGVITRLGFALQVRGMRIPPELLGVLPYVFAIVALVLVSSSRRRSTDAPESLSRPYMREERI